MDDEGKRQTIRWIPRPISVRHIFATQLKKYDKKGSEMFAIQILNAEIENGRPSIGTFPVLRKFQDAFPKEISGLLPKRDIDLTIDIVLGAVPISKAPYRMSVPELTELKMQL
jgi:hypothetical protein